MSGESTALVWFRRDLRLQDNPALINAIKACDRVVLLYIHAPQEEAPWKPGAASNWWLHHSLSSLMQAIARKGGRLILEQGESLQVIRKYIRQFDISDVYWNRLYEPAIIARDSIIKQQLKNDGVQCHSYNAALLNEPHTVCNKGGQPYRVFSAYWRNCEASLHQLSPPLAEPGKLSALQAEETGLGLYRLGLMPKINWYSGLEQQWSPGEAGALKGLQDFIDGAIINYKIDRDIPGVAGTSRLSAALHFGEISPRQILWVVDARMPYEEVFASHRKHFFAEIGWREFSHYLLYHFPESAFISLDARFDMAGWLSSDDLAEELERWKQGITGIPIVDAGMRELWHTGWMHNRVRMIVASVLTKNIGLHWLEGARWFWDTLIDADLAANTMGWQWTAGCGVDAAPYFRVFSPVRQTERFDPHGEYIRRWVPELRTATDKQLREGIVQGKMLECYPPPMLDLSLTRRNSLSRWENIKHSSHQQAC